MPNRFALSLSCFSFLFPVMLTSTGCSRSSGKNLDEIVTMYQQGKKDQAVDSFLTSDWKSKPAFADGSPLKMTEAQFAALSVDDKDKAMKDVLGKTNAIRGLGLAVITKAQELAKTDKRKATDYLEHVVELGRTVAQSDGLKITQLVGQTVQQSGMREITSLK